MTELLVKKFEGGGGWGIISGSQSDLKGLSFLNFVVWFNILNSQEQIKNERLQLQIYSIWQSVKTKI